MNLKPRFEERMKLLLGKDYDNYKSLLDKPYLNSIRCNTLKISVKELKKKLEKKWVISQPYDDHPEIMIIEGTTNNESLTPGEVGRSLEHQLGYFYVQEVSSMMPPIALNPKENQIVFDLAASPGSKTTQIAALMKNTGTLIANDVNIGRVKILSSNLQRCGVTNCIVTYHDGANAAKRLSNIGFQFDKILVDVPCSGEGNIRTNKKTCAMFNEKLIFKMSNKQKQLASSVVKILKVGGEMIYSTCTHAPEENEEVVSYLLENYPVEIQPINLPIKTRPGITSWLGKEYNENVIKCARVYPQDNNTEGFFIAKLKKVEEMKR